MSKKSETGVGNHDLVQTLKEHEHTFGQGYGSIVNGRKVRQTYVCLDIGCAKAGRIKHVDLT